MPMFGRLNCFTSEGIPELCGMGKRRERDMRGWEETGLSTEIEVGTETQSRVDKEGFGKESEVL